MATRRVGVDEPISVMRTGPPPAWPLFIGACVLALILADRGAEDPSAFLAVPAFAAVAGIGYAAYRAPERVLRLAPILILIADTKFRWRDATASLRGEVDGQVMLEVGLYALVGLILAVVTIRKTIRPFPTTMMEVLLVGIGMVAVLSTLWSPSPRFTLVRASQLVVVYALARTLLSVLGPAGTFRALAAALLPYVVLCSAVAIAFPSTVLTWKEVGEVNRFSWFGVWPTQAARFVALAALLLVADFLYGRGAARADKLRVPGWVWVGPLSFLLLLTYSRTALAAFVLAVGALVAVRHIRITRATALIALAAMLALVFVNSDETILGILQRGTESDSWLAKVLFRGQTTDQLSRLSNRVTLWEGVWRLFLERPLYGYGYQGSRGYLLALMPWAGHAHNALAQAVLDLGLIGGIPISIALASCLSPRSLRAAGPGSPMVGWRVTVFAVGLFLLVVAASAGSFAEPGFEAMVFAVCVLGRERVRLEVSARSRPRLRAPGPAVRDGSVSDHVAVTGPPARSGSAAVRDEFRR